MSFEIIDARWAKTTNILLVRCACGLTHEHPANRWYSKCRCGISDYVEGKSLIEFHSNEKGAAKS